MAEFVRYYMDQHIPSAVTEGLRRRGIDVLTAGEANRCGFPDPDQLASADREERTIVSFDPDFHVLHRIGQPHSGIAWCPATKYSIGELIQMLVLLHAVIPRDQMKNHLEYL